MFVGTLALIITVICPSIGVLFEKVNFDGNDENQFFMVYYLFTSLFNVFNMLYFIIPLYFENLATDQQEGRIPYKRLSRAPGSGPHRIDKPIKLDESIFSLSMAYSFDVRGFLYCKNQEFIDNHYLPWID